MLRVVGRQLVRGRADHAQLLEHVALALDAGQYVAHEAAFDAVRLHEDEGAL